MLIAAILLTLVCTSATAMAQTSGPRAPSSVQADNSPSQSQDAAGAFGTWIQQGVANMGAGFGAMIGAVGGQANQAAKDASDAARNAATSVSRLPQTGIAGGQERCVIAPNGAPDCRVAAETMCRAKGYAGGTSVDFVTVEKCPPRWRTSRRDAPEGVCTTEHFVTRALCQ